MRSRLGPSFISSRKEAKHTLPSSKIVFDKISFLRIDLDKFFGGLLVIDQDKIKNILADETDEFFHIMARLKSGGLAFAIHQIDDEHLFRLAARRRVADPFD